MKESSLGAKNIAQRNSQSLIIVCGPEKYGSILDFPPGYGWFNHNDSFIRVNEFILLSFSLMNWLRRIHKCLIFLIPYSPSDLSYGMGPP